MDEQQKWEKLRAYVPKAKEHDFKFQHLHTLNAKPNKPLVRLVASAPDPDKPFYDGPANFGCRLCRKVGLRDENVTGEEIFEHLSNW